MRVPIYNLFHLSRTMGNLYINTSYDKLRYIGRSTEFRMGQNPVYILPTWGFSAEEIVFSGVFYSFLDVLGPYPCPTHPVQCRCGNDESQSNIHVLSIHFLRLLAIPRAWSLPWIQFELHIYRYKPLGDHLNLLIHLRTPLLCSYLFRCSLLTLVLKQNVLFLRNLSIARAHVAPPQSLSLLFFSITRKFF